MKPVPDHLVDRVQAETGFDRMQAINHARLMQARRPFPFEIRRKLDD